MAIVSILIPHKNSTSSLMKLLSTIPSFVPVIIVDDGSCDEEYLYLKNLKKDYSNVKIYRNVGVNNAGNARNLALEKVTTDWVIFADADDLFHKNNLETLILTLDTERSDVVFFNVNAKNNSTNLPSIRAQAYSKLIDEWPKNKNKILYLWPVPWGKAIRKNIIKRNNLKFASRIASNDVEFSADLAVLNPLITIHTAVVYTCVESEVSLTATLTTQKAKDRVKAATNRNITFLKNRAPVRLNFNMKYFIVSLPTLLKCLEFRFFILYFTVFLKVIAHNINLLFKKS